MKEFRKWSIFGEAMTKLGVHIYIFLKIKKKLVVICAADVVLIV